jgi:hypothetical protein
VDRPSSRRPRRSGARGRSGRALARLRSRRFLLFRLFDVWKPGLVGWADRRPGAAGVVLDDLIAGALAALGVILLAALAHGILMR